MRIDIAVFDGIDELDVVGPCETLRAAPGGAFDVRVVSRTPQPFVTGQHAMRIAVDSVYEPGRAELLLVVGGGWVKRNPVGVRGEIARGDWRPLLVAAAARGTILASVCTGAMLLSDAGLTTGRRVATHHAAWDDLRASGAILVNERVVDDGDLLSCGGVTSGIDLGLYIIERFVSLAEAERIATHLEFTRFRPERRAT